MGNPNEFDRELLSAYLDDALESAERSRAEHLLATNAGAARYLDQLRSSRECLKSVPRSHLRSSLAARVLEQARVQALAEGLPNDHHVLRAAATGPTQWDRAADATLMPSSESGTSGVHAIPSARDSWSAQSKLSRSRIAWAAMAIAAAVIGGVAVLPLMSVHQPQGVVAKQAPVESATQATTAQGADESSPFDAVASNAAATASTDKGNASVPDHQPPVRQPNEVAHVMQGAGAVDALKNDLAAQVPALDFLMIIDAVVSTEGWENGRFEKLLEEFGIPIANPIVADRDLIKVLEETRVVVGSADADPAGQQPRAGLVYVRADGATLDRLYQAMHADRESFPQVVTDVSIDPKSALHKLLRGQSAGESRRGPSARVLSASVDVNRTQEVLAQFVPAERPKMVSSDRSSTSSIGNLPGLSPGGDASMSEAIIILREPSSN